MLVLMCAGESLLSGQGVPRRVDELIGWHVLGGQLSLTGRRMGDRMQAAGKERVTIAGVLRDGRGERMIQITLQPSGLFRLDDPTAQRAVGFDGAAVGKRHGNGTASETDDLIETLVLSSPDVLFDALVQQRAAARLVGYRFQVTWGSGPAPNSPFADVYDIYLTRSSKGNPTGRDERLRLAVDSSTLLPVSVRRGSTAESIQASEARFLGWVNQGGQQFPSEIVRMQGGREVFRFRLGQAAVSAKQPDTSFRVP